MLCRDALVRRLCAIDMRVCLHMLMPLAASADDKLPCGRRAVLRGCQRIKELGADPDLLGYVWDGGSSQEYVFAIGSAADSSRVAGDSALSHVGGR